MHGTKGCRCCDRGGDAFFSHHEKSHTSLSHTKFCDKILCKESHKILCRLTQNFVLANTKFCVHKTNFPPTRPFVIEFIVIVTPSYRLEIPTSLIEMSTYQGPTPTLPRSANTCYATTHRRRLGALSRCRLPCRSTAEATITSTSYRRRHNN